MEEEAPELGVEEGEEGEEGKDGGEEEEPVQVAPGVAQALVPGPGMRVHMLLRHSV